MAAKKNRGGKKNKARSTTLTRRLETIGATGLAEQFKKIENDPKLTGKQKRRLKSYYLLRDARLVG